jgi:hypothetical protein
MKQENIEKLKNAKVGDTILLYNEVLKKSKESKIEDFDSMNSVIDFFTDKLNSCIYISGSITKNPNWKKDFKKAEKKLKELGYKNIINPLDLSEQISIFLKKDIDEIDYQTFLNYDLYMLTRYCDKIYMLKGWDKSKGALIEFLEAKNQNMEIIFE